MFEGQTTIKFSKEAGMLMMSQNVSAMFNMSLEVTAMDYKYDGLEITFGPPKKPEQKPEVLSNEESEEIERKEDELPTSQTS